MSKAKLLLEKIDKTRLRHAAATSGIGAALGAGIGAAYGKLTGQNPVHKAIEWSGKGAAIGGVHGALEKGRGKNVKSNETPRKTR